MRTFPCTVISLVFAAVVMTGVCSASAQSRPGEYEVKAAFLYNLLSFVEWPAPPHKTAAPKTIRICVLGQLIAGEAAFDELNGQEMMGKKLEIIHLESEDDLVRCDVLFIGPSQQRNLQRIVKALQGTHVLTIGDSSGFARQGVIINFYLEQKKVRFEINSAAARKAGLTISSKLLKLAGAVYGTTAAGE